MRRFVPEICGVECGSRGKMVQNLMFFFVPRIFGEGVYAHLCSAVSIQHRQHTVRCIHTWALPPPRGTTNVELWQTIQWNTCLHQMASLAFRFYDASQTPQSPGQGYRLPTPSTPSASRSRCPCVEARCLRPTILSVGSGHGRTQRYNRHIPR